MGFRQKIVTCHGAVVGARTRIRFGPRNQLARFSSEFSIGLSQPSRNLVGEILFGTQASHVVKPSNAARSPQNDIPLLETENRLIQTSKSISK